MFLALRAFHAADVSEQIPPVAFQGKNSVSINLVVLLLTDQSNAFPLLSVVGTFSIYDEYDCEFQTFR